jgi:uridine kinase
MTTRSAELRVLLEAIAGRRAPVLVALDGRSGTGKTTLAHSIATSHDAAIVQGDDFFAGGGESHWAALTPAERQCLHRLAPPTHPSPRTAARWAKRTLASLDFASGGGSATMTVDCKPATVILLDGAYSSRPELAASSASPCSSSYPTRSAATAS